jgi:hypothetical protein
MKPHAFIAMPFGKKPGLEGTPIDFNAIYKDLLKPAIEAAGLTVYWTEEEQSADNIKTDRLQELLIADLVVADLTLDDPNVWYELGLRHALRASGIEKMAYPIRPLWKLIKKHLPIGSKPRWHLVMTVKSVPFTNCSLICKNLNGIHFASLMHKSFGKLTMSGQKE